MGKHSGPSAPRAARRIPVGTVAFIVGAVLAWGALVWFAIQLGPDVKSGDLTAWGVLLTASIGAMACLFLGLSQAMKLLEALRTSGPGPTSGEVPHQAAVLVARPVGGRRAKR